MQNQYCMRWMKSVKNFFAEHFPSLASYYRNVREFYRSRIYINRFIKYLNHEYPEICVSLLDVGARGGLNNIPIFGPLKHLKNRLIHGIEPDTEEAERLKKSGEYDHVFTDGVAWYDGEAVLHVPENIPSGASVRGLNLNVARSFLAPMAGVKYNEISIPVKKLSSILPVGMTYDFVKTDVEGCDYDVLASANPTLLEKALCVVCETQTDEIFEGAHSSIDLATYLEGKQFLCYSSLMHANLYTRDMIFIKDPRRISDLETLLKYILLGLLFFRCEDRKFCYNVLRVYEHEHGKQESLGIVYDIIDD